MDVNQNLVEGLYNFARFSSLSPGARNAPLNFTRPFAATMMRCNDAVFRYCLFIVLYFDVEGLRFFFQLRAFCRFGF